MWATPVGAAGEILHAEAVILPQLLGPVVVTVDPRSMRACTRELIGSALALVVTAIAAPTSSIILMLIA